MGWDRYRVNADRSTVPSAKAALVALLEDASWPAPRPQVCYGWPDNLDREYVVVGDTSAGRDQQRSWASIGRGPLVRDEVYALELVVGCSLPGSTQQEATERAFELLAAVEAALIERPQLGPAGAPVPGVTVVALQQPAHTEELLLEGGQPVGRACVIESSVQVRAQIRRTV